MEYTLNTQQDQPKDIAIVTASRYGQTSKVARYMEQQLSQAGVHAKHIALEPNENPETVDWSHYNAIIIGCPVYERTFLPEMLAWTKANLAELNKMKRAFFTVSMNAAVVGQAARIEDDRVLRAFITDTGFNPDFVASIAGKLHYKSYSWFRRMALTRKIGVKHWPVGISKDHEQTDWQQVSAFADAFVNQNKDSRFAIHNRLRHIRSAAA